MFDIEAATPDRIAAIGAVEPSSTPPGVGLSARKPFPILVGDNLNAAEHWTRRAEKWRAVLGATYLNSAAEIGPGGTHLPMMDRRSFENLELLIGRINES